LDKQIIGYIRLNTTREDDSGLSLEAQRSSLTMFAEAEGFRIVAEFVEVETGKGSDALDPRSQLAAALAEARKRKCSVIVAKLNGWSHREKWPQYQRLSGDVHLINGTLPKSRTRYSPWTKHGRSR
jgi:DNA invertase Pin-like site-specific DNA recombinase